MHGPQKVQRDSNPSFGGGPGNHEKLQLPGAAGSGQGLNCRERLRLRACEFDYVAGTLTQEAFVFTHGRKISHIFVNAGHKFEVSLRTILINSAEPECKSTPLFS
jgi:hypothetical protein